MRHSCAISFLKAGGSELALMRLLGHTTLAMTSRYTQWAQADLAAQHREFSPADRLKETR
jgi:integrase/recombinase XerD